VRSWYDYYFQARDDIRHERWNSCVANIDAALRLRPKPTLNARTFGMEFVDYLPYYYRGLCLLNQEDYQGALAAFNRAEEGGAAMRSDVRPEMARMRGEARAAENARMTREAKAEWQRLFQQAQDLGRKRSWDEALTYLAQAEVIARELDSESLRQVTQLRDRLREDQRKARDAAARAQRIQDRLADGDRLLDDGRLTEAVVAYDEVLELDPRNTRATEGRRLARERILASSTRAARERSFAEGKALFDAGKYEAALGPLTDAAVDTTYTEAHELLAKTREIVENMTRQRELRAEIERLFSRGEDQMKARHFPEAQVAFESVLELDPGHQRARERLAEAERRTGETIFQRWFPDLDPELALFVPGRPSVESGTGRPGGEADSGNTTVEGPTFLLQGVASDDRALQKVEFRVGDTVVGEILADTDAPAPVRTMRFTRELPLEPGPNQITVTAVDTGGQTRTLSFPVQRNLLFYETPFFLPSAGAAAVALVGIGFGAQGLRRRRARRRRFNPYIAGAPVLDDDMFYGREKLTARMLSTLHRNSLMITGERRIGKTTFLHHLARVLAADEGSDWRFFPVFVDLQGVPEQAFFHALMGDVVDALELGEDTRARVRLRPEPEGYDAREFSHDLKLVIAELATRTPKRVKLALLIDEVDVLNEYSESVNQRLRGIFMKSFSENLVAVMSGVGIKRRWKSEVSPWYNFFDEIELSPFTRDEAEALVREPVAGVFRWKAEAVDRILELSRLRPYLVQKYCVHALNRMLEDGRGTVRLSDVEAAREVVELEEAQWQPDPGAPADHVAVAD